MDGLEGWKRAENRVGLIAKITDEVSLSYNFTESTIRRSSTTYGDSGGVFRPTSTRTDNRHDDYRHTASLVYQGKDNGIRALLGYNYRKVDGYNYLTKKPVDSNTVMESYIFDLQKTWKLDSDTFVLGYSYKRELADLTVSQKSASRTGNSLYASYSKQFTPKFNFTLGLRGEWIDDPKKDQRVFMPQFQTNYQLDRNTAWYINVGKAFQMPAVDDTIGKRQNTSGLKPESGWTYETGVKIRRGNDMWKVAIYHMDMENKLGWAQDPVTHESVAINKGNFRNTGVEAEYSKRFNDAWKLTLGGSVSNPKVQDPSVKKKEWVQDAGRLEGLVRLDYEMAKWQGNLNLKYLGDREYYAPTRRGKAQDIPDKLQLNMNVIYTAGKDDVVSLGIYNLLNRENYSNRYGNLDLGRNFRLTYTHAF